MEMTSFCVGVVDYDTANDFLILIHQKIQSGRYFG